MDTFININYDNLKNNFYFNTHRIPNSLFISNGPFYQNVQAFAPGSPERDSLRAELARVEATCKDIPIVIGGQEIRNDNVKYQVSPYNHSQKIAKYYWADKDLLHKAANAAVAAQVRLWPHFTTYQYRPIL